MEKIFQPLVTIIAILISITLSACSSNQGLQRYSIDQAMNSMPEDVRAKLGDFKFYFGESAGWGAKELGQVQTSLRTNAFAKEPQLSCNRVFYSALINLKGKAEDFGGNAVANIQSNWKNNKTSSESTYVCDNGVWMSGVALTGVAVKE